MHVAVRLAVRMSAPGAPDTLTAADRRGRSREAPDIMARQARARKPWPQTLKGDIPFAQPATIYCGMAPPEAARLRAGVDYPTDLSEFDRFFPSEEACARFLEHLRWPTGFVRPKCGVAAEAWRMSRGLLLCTSCRAQTSVTAGTIFEGTRKPLKLWFIAAWEITGHKYGANALNVKRMLGVKSYKTAWSWLHKFRRAMVRPGRDRLSGVVEVDETYVGGEEQGGRGRFTEKKAIVAVAVELKERGYGRIRLRRIPNVKTATLEQFVTEMIEPGAVVHTDAWTGYRNLEQLGYAHRVTNQSKSEDPAHVLMPGVHRVASLLKRWLLGTFQGSVSNAHLNYYLDEFTFRFNRRGSTSRGLLFYRVLEQAVQTDHTPTHALFLGTGRGGREW
jgi:transposase-like protein